MKRLLTTFLCSAVFALTMFGQDVSPSPSVGAILPTTPAPIASPAINPSPAPSAAVTAIATVAESDDADSDFERRIEEKVRKHFRVKGDRRTHEFDGDFEAGEMLAIPIVGIIFTTLFGAPVLVVAVIMFMNYLKARSLHRTVRTMVEKGQEVPAALFVAPPAQRRRSDLRRGIVLVMVGLGLSIFLGAVNDWEGGAWSLGMIPLLMGAGYLLVWKLEGRGDNGTPVA